MSFHDEKDSREQLRKDGDPYGHTPDSVRESALREIERRYGKEERRKVAMGERTPWGER